MFDSQCVWQNKKQRVEELENIKKLNKLYPQCLIYMQKKKKKAYNGCGDITH